ncbi:MAG: hypothetical protein R2736_19755 [Solirubrobacterales bacterium]
MLRNGPTAASLWARTLIGPLYAANLLRYVGIQSWPQWLQARNVLSQRAQATAGLAWVPTVAKAAYAPDAYALRTPYVAETTPAFLTWLSTIDLAAPPVISTAPPPVPQPAALLDVLARHATGRAFADAAGQAAPEGELLGFGGAEPLKLTPGTSPALTELQAALATLAAQPPAVLERHLTASLDLAAHRLDAWITAIASQRLVALRAGAPTGVRVGAFGWVEGLTPRSEAPASEGWIAAPSLGHATTAVVLRNGYRARRLEGEPPGTLAVDLSSRRVRRALRLLAGVRAGRSLGALLGEHLERALHDAQLDALIEGLCGYAPAPDGGAVDGLLIAQRWRDAHDLPGFALDGNRALVTPLLDTLDAVGDLTLAEGVHQVVAGNPVRAGALFDALGRGEQPPPELAVTRTPRGAVHHAVSLLVALPPHARRPSGTWPHTPDSVRAAAEPVADAWAARVLGPAHDATFAVEWRTAQGGVVARAEGTLADTGLAPLDVVYESGRPGALDGWLVRAVAPPAAIPDEAAPVLAQAPLAALELARTLRRVLVAARPATGTDLDADAPTAAGDAGATAGAGATADAGASADAGATADAGASADAGATAADPSTATSAHADVDVDAAASWARPRRRADARRGDRHGRRRRGRRSGRCARRARPLRHPGLPGARRRAARRCGRGPTGPWRSPARGPSPRRPRPTRPRSSAHCSTSRSRCSALCPPVRCNGATRRSRPPRSAGWIQVGRARAATGALSDLLLCDEAPRPPVRARARAAAPRRERAVPDRRRRRADRAAPRRARPPPRRREAAQAGRRTARRRLGRAGAQPAGDRGRRLPPRAPGVRAAAGLPDRRAARPRRAVVDGEPRGGPGRDARRRPHARGPGRGAGSHDAAAARAAVRLQPGGETISTNFSGLAEA